MLKRLMIAAMYVVPGMLVLVAFGAGHLFLEHESDRLHTYRVENGLISPPPEAPEVPQETAAEEGPEPEVTPDGVVIPPSYSYFSFMMPFTGNIGETRRLFKMDVSVSIFGSPLRNDGQILRLQELEAELRPVVLEQMQGYSEEYLRTPEGRADIASDILTALNELLVTLGEEIELSEAVITNFLLT